jgi:hypothetical protein
MFDFGLFPHTLAGAMEDDPRLSGGGGGAGAASGASGDGGGAEEDAGAAHKPSYFGLATKHLERVERQPTMMKGGELKQ